MRTVLVTGAAGRVGRPVVRVLESAGWRVRAFDLVYGEDVRDEAAVAAATQGCDAVVHAAALAHDTAGTAADIVATNILGTWHVLVAAEAYEVSRIVVFSSAQVFGFAEGEGVPEYLPVDDAHPRRAARPYGMSKRLVEDMCAAWTSRCGLPSVVLRPVMIRDDDDLCAPSHDVAPDLSAFVHVDDVAAAVALALDAPISGHTLAILCGPGEFDCAVARQVLGWRPTRTWPDE